MNGLCSASPWRTNHIVLLAPDAGAAIAASEFTMAALTGPARDYRIGFELTRRLTARHERIDGE